MIPVEKAKPRPSSNKIALKKPNKKIETAKLIGLIVLLFVIQIGELSLYASFRETVIARAEKKQPVEVVATTDTEYYTDGGSFYKFLGEAIDNAIETHEAKNEQGFSFIEVAFIILLTKRILDVVQEKKR